MAISLRSKVYLEILLETVIRNPMDDAIRIVRLFMSRFWKFLTC